MSLNFILFRISFWTICMVLNRFKIGLWLMYQGGGWASVDRLSFKLQFSQLFSLELPLCSNILNSKSGLTWHFFNYKKVATFTCAQYFYDQGTWNVFKLRHLQSTLFLLVVIDNVFQSQSNTWNKIACYLTLLFCLKKNPLPNDVIYGSLRCSRPTDGVNHC